MIFVYFKDKIKRGNGNKTPSDSSNDRTDNESESESVANVLNWLQSLPPNFTKRDFEDSTNLYKLQETDQNLYRFNTRQESSKSLGSSSKRKSNDKLPLEVKNDVLLLEPKKKVEFVKLNETRYELDRRRMKSFQRKILTRDKKSSIDSSVSKLSKRSANSDLHSIKTKSRQSLISIKNNQSQGKTIGILKNITENKLKGKLSCAQRRKIQKKIADNKRLICVLNEIIKAIEKSDISDRKKNIRIRNDHNKKWNEGGNILILNDIKYGESRGKRPVFKNPAIEKTLDDTMRDTLKRYVHSNNWNHFEKNNIDINVEPPVKKKRCTMPSLISADSLTPYILI